MAKIRKLKYLTYDSQGLQIGQGILDLEGNFKVEKFNKNLYRLYTKIGYSLINKETGETLLKFINDDELSASLEEVKNAFFN